MPKLSRPSKWTRRVWVANCCWPPTTPGKGRKSRLWVLWQNLTTCLPFCKHFRALPIQAKQRAEERPLGDFWQSVPRNGRVHLHIIEINSRIANPPAPYSIPNAPNLKFVKNLSRRLFFGVQSGEPNFVKICRNFEKWRFPDKFSKFRQIFDKIWVPLIGTPKTIVGANFWQISGSGHFGML